MEASGTFASGHTSIAPGGRRRGWVRALVGLLLAGVLALVGLAAAVLLMGGATIAPDSAGGLAQVDVEALGGTFVGATATDPRGHRVPLKVRDGSITPLVHVAPGTLLTVTATVKRPGWTGWALGKQSRQQLTVRAPSAPLRTKWTTVAAGDDLEVSFASPVARLTYGTPGHMRHVTLHHPRRTVDLGRQAAAGTLLVSGAPRAWERLPKTSSVTWFPAGRTTTAVTDPAPETPIGPTSKIALTFSKPLSQLGSARPTFARETPGSWKRRDSHTLVFTPSGTGFGMGAKVDLTLPAGAQLASTSSTGAQTVADTSSDSASTGGTVSWTVPPGSTLRLHELLAQLGYLPLTFHSDTGTPVGTDDSAQLQAAVAPPRGTFDWRWDLPSQLTSQWDPDATTAITRGALMAFQSDRGLTVDGLAGPDVWGSLIAAVRDRKGNRHGYSYVLVHRDAAQQTATLIHDGKTIITTPGNTGVPAAPTELGTFPVFLRYEVTTMVGTNPDGSRYNDPGIKWVSYFNGGDALHAFNRASFGTPQSVGCVELPEAAAKTIYPYTPIGTLVQVAA